MKDIERFIEILKLSPRHVHLDTLKKLPDGLYKCYTSIKVENIKNYENSWILEYNGLNIIIKNFNRPILEGDVLMFRNFIKKGNDILVRGEIIVDRSEKKKIKIKNGVLPLIKGQLEKKENVFILKTSKREIPIELYNGWREIFDRKLNKYIIIRNAIYDKGKIIFNKNTEVYLEI